MKEKIPKEKRRTTNYANFSTCPYWEKVDVVLKDFLTWILPINNINKISKELPYFCKIFESKMS